MERREQKIFFKFHKVMTFATLLRKWECWTLELNKINTDTDLK